MQAETKLPVAATRAFALAIASAAVIWAGQASAATLVNDQFADAERSNQNPPASLQWFGVNSSVTLDASGGNLLIPEVSNSGALAFFAASDAPLAMGVGDSLKLSFSITTPATGGQTGDNSFLYGFINSGGTRPTADGGFNSSTYNNDTGYFAVAPLAGAHPARNKIVERFAGANNLITSANFLQLGAGSATPDLAPGGTYLYSLEMTLTSESEMTLTSDMGGVQLVRSDDTPLTTFDSIFIFTGGNPAVTIDNVVVEHIAAIPEPATVGLIALSGAAILLRRRA